MILKFGFDPENVPKRIPESQMHTNAHPKPSSITLCKSYVRISADLICSSSELPGSPTVAVDIEVTFITVSWTKPGEDGGSPITAYRVLILRGNREVENTNTTDFTTTQLDIGGLTKSTNYTIKLFAKNYVFEGKATKKKIRTKLQGSKIC